MMQSNCCLWLIICITSWECWSCNRQLNSLVFMPQFQSFSLACLYMFSLCNLVSVSQGLFWMSYLFYAGDLKLHEAVMFYMNNVQRDRFLNWMYKAYLSNFQIWIRPAHCISHSLTVMWGLLLCTVSRTCLDKCPMPQIVLVFGRNKYSP